MRDPAAVADVGIIGGTGFYSFLADAEEHVVATPYGDPSAPVTVGEVAGRRVAFLPRHGEGTATRRTRDQLPREPLGAAGRSASARCWRRARSAGCADRWRRATSWCPTSSSTAPAAGSGSYVETGAVHLPFADPYCPRLLGDRRRRSTASSRRHHGGRRGTAVLHPRGVAATTPPRAGR